MTKTLTQRFEQAKAHLTMGDLALDVLGKFLVGVGVGVLCAGPLAGWGWPLIIAGVLPPLFIKAKHWRHFWS